jgi:hypothetical protein
MLMVTVILPHCGYNFQRNLSPATEGKITFLGNSKKKGSRGYLCALKKNYFFLVFAVLAASAEAFRAAVF